MLKCLYIIEQASAISLSNVERKEFFFVVLFSCGDSEKETKIKEAEEKRIENDEANRYREYQKSVSSDDILKLIQE